MVAPKIFARRRRWGHGRGRGRGKNTADGGRAEGQVNAREVQGKGSGMAGRLRRPIITIIIIFCFLSILKRAPLVLTKNGRALPM